MPLLPTAPPVPPTDPTKFPLLGAFAAIEAVINNLTPLFFGRACSCPVMAALTVAWWGVQTALAEEGVRWSRFLLLVLCRHSASACCASATITC